MRTYSVSSSTSISAPPFMPDSCTASIRSTSRRWKSASVSPSIIYAARRASCTSNMWTWRNLWRPLKSRPAIPDDLWQAALVHLPYCQALDADTQARLRKLALRFLRAKSFEGAAGLRVTDAMRVHVALQGCLLILNLDFDYYAGWHARLLYPGDFRVSKEYVDEAGVVHHWHEDLSGESWEQGPVILSWDAATATTDA